MNNRATAQRRPAKYAKYAKGGPTALPFPRIPRTTAFLSAVVASLRFPWRCGNLPSLRRSFREDLKTNPIFLSPIFLSASRLRPFVVNAE